MKLAHLSDLVRAAELGLTLLTESAYDRHRLQDAIQAAQIEESQRRAARDLTKAQRPARTVRREAIRQNLLKSNHKVRLTRSGEWHVQLAPRTSWMLFALSDSDAENKLDW